MDGAPDINPLALSIEDAARSLAVSKRTFRRHVLPHPRVTMCGRRRLIAIRELQRYLDDHAV